MQAERINPALLRNVDSATIADAMIQHSNYIENTFESCELFDKQPQMESTKSIRTGDAFAVGLELHEFLCERDGLPIVSDAPVLDWYGEAAPVGIWESMPPAQKSYKLIEMNDRKRGLSADDTSCD